LQNKYSIETSVNKKYKNSSKAKNTKKKLEKVKRKIRPFKKLESKLYRMMGAREKRVYFWEGYNLGLISVIRVYNKFILSHQEIPKHKKSPLSKSQTKLKL